MLAKGGYTIPMRYPLMNAVASGFIVTGDAAFHANPFSAEGHEPVLVAGYYAGKSSLIQCYITLFISYFLSDLKFSWYLCCKGFGIFFSFNIYLMIQVR
ncbi:MAG: hypothetical protein ACFFB5_24335 [Promethearchaeota archaeon]